MIERESLIGRTGSRRPYDHIAVDAETGVRRHFRVGIEEAELIRWSRDRVSLREQGFPDRPPDFAAGTLRLWHIDDDSADASRMGAAGHRDRRLQLEELPSVEITHILTARARSDVGQLIWGTDGPSAAGLVSIERDGGWCAAGKWAGRQSDLERLVTSGLRLLIGAGFENFELMSARTFVKRFLALDASHDRATTATQP